VSINVHIFDLSRTTGPISTKLDRKHLGFKICSNEGKIIKLKDTVKFFLFSRTSRTISIRLVTNHPWVKGMPPSEGRYM
jgi:hypothetical protein